MATNTDDVEDDYLDDPISLVAIEDIKTEKCDEEDQIFDVSSDEEETCTSAYGKKNFVLPVTFFDISRNVRLLNKCKPLSIKIVDCKQHPTYYTKYQEKCKSNTDENRGDVDNKCKSDSETKHINVTSKDNVIIISATDNADKKEENHIQHMSKSFYEKLKRRKEERKQLALNCKDLTQIDFKRNKGLVGLKITDSIFKKIVDTEVALSKSNCSSVENQPKETNKNVKEYSSIAIKTVTPQDTFKDQLGTIGVEKTCNENNEKYESHSDNNLLVTTKYKTADSKCKEKRANVTEKMSIKKTTRVENKSNDKNKNEITDKANIVTKSLDTNENKSKEKSEGVELNSDVIESKEKMPRNAEKTLITNQFNSTKQMSKDEIETDKYMRKVSAALDNHGTSIIPLANNHHCAPKNLNELGISENNTIKISHQADAKDKLGNNKDFKHVRCSLKTSSNNVIENIKKKKEHKKAKPGYKNVKITDYKQKATEEHTSIDVIAAKRNDDVCKTSDKRKLHSKCTNRQQVDHSNETKEVEKTAYKQPSEEQAGPNSPVIPCTTITVRNTVLKMTPNVSSSQENVLSEKTKSVTSSTVASAKSQNLSAPNYVADHRTMSSHVQKQSNLSKVSTLSREDLINSKNANTSSCTESGTHIPQAKIGTKYVTKGSLIYNQKSNSALNTAELKKLRNSISAHVSTVTEKALSDQNFVKPNMNMTKVLNLGNAILKLTTSAENAVQATNKTVNGLINSQANSNQQVNIPTPPTARPKCTGPNAIILRRPPLPLSQPLHNNPPSSQGQPIQIVLNNRFQYQPMPHGPRAFRFHAPLRYPPPQPPPPPPARSPPPLKPPQPPNAPNLPQVRPMPQRFTLPNRMPLTYLQGMDPGLQHWRPYPPAYRPPLSAPSYQENLKNNPRPPISQINKDSLIGNSANGDPIKKINLPVVSNAVNPIKSNNIAVAPQTQPNTVNDKQTMLAELNNAAMSPELIKDNQEDKSSNALKRKVDAASLDPAKPKHSKPGPLSKKMNLAPESNNAKLPNKVPSQVGYSPPILPIFTYQESYKIFSPNDAKKALTRDETPRPKSRKLEQAKKISFEDYRRRVAKDDGGKIDVYKKRKYDESKNMADDFNQDQGYDSDSTVKL